MGGGCIDAHILLSFLDLPHGKSMESGKINRIEQKLSPVICEITEKVLDQALEEEVYLQLKADNRISDFEKWKMKVNIRRPLLTVCYDMGWQQKASGRKYDSNSGHGVLIGSLSGKVIAFKVRSKSCRICSFWGSKKMTPPTHICTRNHFGSSKSMEADVILELCVELWDKKDVGLGCIVLDDDTTIRSNLKHSLEEKVEKKIMREDEWPLNKKGKRKSCSGRLPLHVKEPTFLSDPSHWKKTVGKHLYHMANLPKYKSKVTKELASKLMTAYGYMLFNIRHLDWNKDRKLVMDKAKAPLEHRFNNHVYCDPSWCRSKRAANEGKIYTAPEHDPFYCKKNNSEMYIQLKELFDQFTCEDVIKDSVHSANTQKNEALNNVIARLCPKNKHLCGSLTLLTRICIAVTYTNIGFEEFYKKVLECIGISNAKGDIFSNILLRLLRKFDQNRTTNLERKKTATYKAKRKYADKYKIKEQLYLDGVAEHKKCTYQTGIGMPFPYMEGKSIIIISKTSRIFSLSNNVYLPS